MTEDILNQNFKDIESIGQITYQYGVLCSRFELELKKHTNMLMDGKSSGVDIALQQRKVEALKNDRDNTYIHLLAEIQRYINFFENASK